MTAPEEAKKMLLLVARALGQNLLDEVAFVGGCTTSLLITDEFSLEAARFTDDVDVIVDIVGRLEWYKFQSMLRDKGFAVSPDLVSGLSVFPPLTPSALSIVTVPNLKYCYRMQVDKLSKLSIPDRRKVGCQSGH